MTHYLVRKEIHIQRGLTRPEGWFHIKKKKSIVFSYEQALSKKHSFFFFASLHRELP